MVGQVDENEVGWCRSEGRRLLFLGDWAMGYEDLRWCVIREV